jgi:hypothetical protein
MILDQTEDWRRFHQIWYLTLLWFSFLNLFFYTLIFWYLTLLWFSFLKCLFETKMQYFLKMQYFDFVFSSVLKI